MKPQEAAFLLLHFKGHNQRVLLGISCLAENNRLIIPDPQRTNPYNFGEPLHLVP